MKRKVICAFFESEQETDLVHIFGSRRAAQEFIKTIPQDKKPLYFFEDWEVIDV